MPRHKGDGAERHDLGDEHEGEHGSEGEHREESASPAFGTGLPRLLRRRAAASVLSFVSTPRPRRSPGPWSIRRPSPSRVFGSRCTCRTGRNSVRRRGSASRLGKRVRSGWKPKANALKPGRRMRRLVRGNTGNGIAERATRDCGPPGRGADQRSAVPRLRAAMPPAGRRPATCRARRGKARPSRRGFRSTSASRCGGRTPCLPARLAGEAAGPLPTPRGS